MPQQKVPVTTYLPPEVHKRLKIRAVEDGRSVTNLFEEFACRWLTGEIKSDPAWKSRTRPCP